jgi:hypothetical protein
MAVSAIFDNDNFNDPRIGGPEGDFVRTNDAILAARLALAAIDVSSGTIWDATAPMVRWHTEVANLTSRVNCIRRMLREIPPEPRRTIADENAMFRLRSAKVVRTAQIAQFGHSVMLAGSNMYAPSPSYAFIEGCKLGSTIFADACRSYGINPSIGVPVMWAYFCAHIEKAILGNTTYTIGQTVTNVTTFAANTTFSSLNADWGAPTAMNHDNDFYTTRSIGWCCNYVSAATGLNIPMPMSIIGGRGQQAGTMQFAGGGVGPGRATRRLSRRRSRKRRY